MFPEMGCARQRAVMVVGVVAGVVLVEAELEVLMLPESQAIQILEAVEVEVGIRQEELVDQV